MLILSRHVGESVIIGENITMTLLRVWGNLARICIEAPSSIEIYRDELYERIQQEKASHTSALQLVM